MMDTTPTAGAWRLVGAEAAADLLMIDSQTVQLVAAVTAAEVPVARRDALTALLGDDNAGAGLRLLELQGALARLLPEIAALRGISQLPDHAMDALDHTYAVVDAAPPTPLSRWTALFHDSGKAATRLTTPEGRTRFFGHEHIGADLVRAALPRLALSPPFIAQVAGLVDLHLRPLAYRPEWGDGAVRRLLEEAGTHWPALLAQARADLRGYAPEPVAAALANLDALERRAAALLAPPPAEPPGSPLDGDELQRIFGLPPGPWIGRVKAALEVAVREGALAADDKATALDMAAAILERETANRTGPAEAS